MIITKYNKFFDKKIDKKYLLKGIKKTINGKPSKKFDDKYGTTLSQEYNFPFDLTADDVWDIIQYNIGYYYIKNKEISEKYIILIDNLTNEHFPYVNLDNIDYNQKSDILYGMASGFNYNDIIWFSINEMYHSKNDYVNKEFEKFPNQIKKDIGWVVSPKTLEKMKNQLKNNNFL